MRILVAEDDPASRRLLEGLLSRSGHEVLVTRDGEEAWDAMRREDAPSLAIVDWMMPGVDGTELCRRARALSAVRPLYIILLTARGSQEDIVAGLEAGADDYVTKPFGPEELRARVRVAERVLALQSALADRVRELEEALANVRTLRGMLPICSSCKMIRDDQGYWQQVEVYLLQHTEAEFSHGLCPACLKRLYPETYEKMRREGRRAE